MIKMVVNYSVGLNGDPCHLAHFEKFLCTLQRVALHIEHLGTPVVPHTRSPPCGLQPTPRSRSFYTPPSEQIISSPILSHGDSFHFERWEWSKHGLGIWQHCSSHWALVSLSLWLSKSTAFLIICTGCDNTIYIFILFSSSLSHWQEIAWLCSLNANFICN